MAGLSVLFFASTLSAQTVDESAAPAPASKVRIVRLSEVKGDVQVDRSTGRGFEPAMANLPIVEKNRLQTGVGVAEVEFEDNSTLRVAPNSVVEFPKLERLPGGTTASTAVVVQGSVYVSLMKTAGNEFNLLFGQQMLRLPPSSHVRLQLGDTQARLAVLDGLVHVNGPGGGMDVTKKKTVTLPLNNQAQPTLAKEVAPDPLDSWDKDAAAYHERTAIASNYGNPGYSYGLNDMMYYGNFTSMGGCGTMWRPYFASAAWDPYSNGAWAWYGGAGYSWVSPYPWGWTPYHYGSWSFCDGAGWGWMPGGSWNGLNNTALLAPASGTGGGPRRMPVTPPAQAPAANEPTLRAVNLKPAVRSEVASPESFVFRKDSAGLGVPRETLGKLDKFSQQSIQHGMASTEIHLSAPAATSANGRTANSAIAPIAVRRGAAPSAGEASQGRESMENSGGSSSRAASSPSASMHSGGGRGH
jgi:hypothetical protein